MPVDPRHGALTVEVQERESSSTLNFTRKSLNWRAGHRALIDGAISCIDAQASALAFERSTVVERVGIVFNLGEQDLCFEIAAGRSAPGWSRLDRIDSNKALPRYGAAYWRGTD